MAVTCSPCLHTATTSTCTCMHDCIHYINCHSSLKRCCNRSTCYWGCYLCSAVNYSMAKHLRYNHQSQPQSWRHLYDHGWSGTAGNTTIIVSVLSNFPINTLMITVCSIHCHIIVSQMYHSISYYCITILTYTCRHLNDS